MYKRQLEDLATRDPLSGCLNRRAFNVGLHRLYDQALESGRTLVCIMADIDHFKSINDRFGHQVGDEVIRSVATILTDGVRSDDLVGRYGGEEFCVVIAGITRERGGQLVEKLRERIAANRSVRTETGEQIEFTASFGMTWLDLGARNEVELVDQADQAMYAAKQAGRNRTITYSKHGDIAPELVTGTLP